MEKWVTHQGRSFLELHANPSALTFYQRAGYIAHPFPEDNKEHLTRNCVDLMKNLKR